MSNLSLSRWWGSKRTTGARARRVPVGAHEGDRQAYLRRHERAAREAALASPKRRREFAKGLLTVAADPRNLMCAIDSLVSKGDKAPGPNGLRLETLSAYEQWELVHTLSTALSTGTYRPGPVRRKRVPKTSGTGTRLLEIPNAEDKVVQRAIVQAVQPLLDPNFDERSFGFRPGLSREHALATADMLIASESAVITEDFQDAFGQIPHGRLLGVLRHHGLADDVLERIGQIIQNGRKRGLRQGGPLSPLLMNAYGDHFVDKPWRKRHPGIPLIRVADDTLLISPPETDPSQIYAQLEELTLPASLPLKHGPTMAIRHLRLGQHADWLGYQLRLGEGELEAHIGPECWHCLAQHLDLAHEDPRAPLVAPATILGWVDQLGPCYQHEDVRGVHARVVSLTREHSFKEVPSLEEFREMWKRAHVRFQRLRRVLLLQGAGRFASGYARRQHEPAAHGRGGGASAGDAPPPSLLPEVTVYTDGSCSGARGIGGWAFVIHGPADGERRCRADSHLRTTSNRMELTAVVRALEALEEPSKVTVITDSEYFFRGVTEWLPRWKHQDWRSGSPGRTRPLKNVRLWQRLDDMLAEHAVTVEWVKGHSGNPGNEEVDKLARAAAG